MSSSTEPLFIRVTGAGPESKGDTEIPLLRERKARACLIAQTQAHRKEGRLSHLCKQSDPSLPRPQTATARSESVWGNPDKARGG